tara:strand:+ start:791 stop:1234 length:444 start_codon:yes stop_codon:yes gene_type:complete
MRVLGLLMTVFGFVFFASLAYASEPQNLVIEMLNKRDDGQKMVYSMDVAEIEVGDTITWVPTSKGHNVQIIAAPEGYEIPKKSKLSKEVTLDFSVPGMYYYICTPHKAMGMIGLIIVGGDTSNKEEIAKVKAVGKSKKKLKKLLDEL